MSSIKLITFDLDDTLITQNSWVTLNAALGVSPEEDMRLYKEYVSNILSYDNWLGALLSLYQKNEKARRTYINETLTQYVFVSGAEECIANLKSKGYELAIISGSFDIIVNHVAQKLGITHTFASNTLIFDAKDKISSIQHSGDADNAKLIFLKELLVKLSLKPEECACVADGVNDLPMFALTRHGITFKGLPIEKNAWRIVSSFSEIPALIENA